MEECERLKGMSGRAGRVCLSVGIMYDLFSFSFSFLSLDRCIAGKLTGIFVVFLFLFLFFNYCRYSS